MDTEIRPWHNWIAHRTSNSGVAGSSPAGRAIFHPPNLKMIEDYVPRVNWNYYLEFHVGLAIEMLQDLDARHASYAFAVNRLEVLGVVEVHQRVIDGAMRHFPSRLLQLCNVTIQLPYDDRSARVIKHRWVSPPPEGRHADKYLDDRLQHIISLR